MEERETSDQATVSVISRLKRRLCRLDPVHETENRAASVSIKQHIAAMVTCIYIWHSELQYICRRAYRQGAIEVGGWLHGGWTNRGDALIWLACPPGPNAQYGYTSFVQDFQWQTALDRRMVDRFGLCSVGKWHAHHVLGICGPSSEDQRIDRGIVSKNVIHGFAQIIITFDYEGARKMRVHSSFQTEQQTSPCPLRIIPGLSPIRRVLFDTDIFPDHEDYMWEYPETEIECDTIQPAHAVGATQAASEIPTALTAQFDALPIEVQEDIFVTTEQQGMVTVSLPLPNERRVEIGYMATKASSPHSISVEAPDKKREDITDAVNPQGSPLTMARAYHKILAIVSRSGQKDRIETRPQEKLPPPEAPESIRTVAVRVKTSGAVHQIVSAETGQSFRAIEYGGNNAVRNRRT